MPALKDDACDAQAPSATLFPFVFGAIHALVDASTVLAVFAASRPWRHGPEWPRAFWFVLAYDLLAFGGQTPLGLATDRCRFYRGITLAGLGLSALSLVFLGIEPVTTLLLAGFGNAAFHVGAGALSLRVRPGRAAPPGIFVAPGALGLWLGSYLGKSERLPFSPHLPWLFFAGLLVALIVAGLARIPDAPLAAQARPPNIRMPITALLLLLFSISVRSFIGFSAASALPPAAAVSFALACAAFAGKALGGILSDRLGWIRTSVGALLVSAPLIAFGGVHPHVVAAGMFLFQMTMPVTLVAVWCVLPARPALAFGLACLALVLGAVPAFSPWAQDHGASLFFLMWILLSAGAVCGGLGLLRGEVPMRFPRERGEVSGLEAPRAGRGESIL